MKKILFLIFFVLVSHLFARESNLVKFNSAILSLYNNKSLLNLKQEKSIKTFKDIKIGRFPLYYESIYIPIDYYISKAVFGGSRKDLSYYYENISDWKNNKFIILKDIYNILEQEYKFLAYLYFPENKRKSMVSVFHKQKLLELEYSNKSLINIEKIEDGEGENFKPVLKYLNLFKNTKYLRKFEEYNGGDFDFLTDSKKIRNFLDNFSISEKQKIDSYYDNCKVLNNYFLSSYQFFRKYKSFLGKRLYSMIRFKSYNKIKKFYIDNFIKVKGNIIKKEIDKNNIFLNIYNYKNNLNSYIYPSSLILLSLYKKEKKKLTKNEKKQLYLIFNQLLKLEKQYLIDVLDNGTLSLLMSKYKVNENNEKVRIIFFK